MSAHGAKATRSGKFTGMLQRNGKWRAPASMQHKILQTATRPSRIQNLLASMQQLTLARPSSTSFPTISRIYEREIEFIAYYCAFAATTKCICIASQLRQMWEKSEKPEESEESPPAQLACAIRLLKCKRLRLVEVVVTRKLIENSVPLLRSPV